MARGGYSWDVVGWHALMAAWMVAMVAVSLPGGFVRAGLGVFAIGAAWGVLRLKRPVSRGVHLRLSVCCGAMVVMLAVGAVAGAQVAPAAVTATMNPSAAMGAMSAMPGSGLAGAPRVFAMLALAVLLVMLVCHLAGLLLQFLRNRRTRPGELGRVGRSGAAFLELGTATAMAAMLGFAL